MNIPQYLYVAIEIALALAICAIIILSIIALVYAIRIMQRKLYNMKMEDYIQGIENEIKEIGKDVNHKIREEKAETTKDDL